MPAPARSTVTSMVTSDNRPAALAVSRRISLSKGVRRETIIGWLFVLPALLMYAVFVLAAPPVEHPVLVLSLGRHRSDDLGRA